MPLSLIHILSLSILFINSIQDAQAVTFPFTVQHNVRSDGNHLQRRHLGKRANTTIPIDNKANAQYITNITLAGQNVRVLLDTGSSDLWVNFPGSPPQTQDLGKSVELNYAIGAAKGNVHTAPMEFDSYSIPDQAFLLVTDASSFSTDIHKQGYDGLLGLGPNTGSQISDKIDESPKGDSVINRIFTVNKTTNNFISFLLDRKNDPTVPFTGQLTISEIIPGFEKISQMPKMDVETVHKLVDEDQHWQALTDKDKGIIGPDGQVIQVDSIVPKAPDGQLVTVFDSGFTFNQVPRSVSDAIYGRVQGAKYDSKHEWWTVPCEQELNITLNIGGNAYPVHPLDVVDADFGITDPDTGKTVCIGTFQPITTAFSLLGNYDMIMGMAFLRNTYTLLDYGNWIDGGGDTEDPYIQLLSVTDASQAHSDFVQQRLNGVDLTGDPKYALLPTSQMQHSPISDAEKKAKYEEMILSRWPYILAGCLVALLLIIGCIVWRCCCRRGRRGPKADKLARGLSQRFGKGGPNRRPSVGGMEGGYGAAFPGDKSEAYLPLQAAGSSNNLMSYGGGGHMGKESMADVRYSGHSPYSR